MKARRFGTVIGLLVLCAVLWALTPHFLTVSNLLNIAQQTSINAIVAAGMTFVILSGGIDLSVGSIVALSGVALGALFGLAHGLLITRGRIEPFIVTLGTLGIFRAYLTYFADGGALTLDNELSDLYAPVYYASLLGIPVPVASHRKPSSKPDTGRPSVNTSAVPRATLIIPSVAMNGGRPPMLTINPLSSPQPVPTAIAPGMAMNGD